MRSILFVTLSLAALAFPEVARADDEPRPEPRRAVPAEPERAKLEAAKPDTDTVDMGVLGGVGFPHPIAIEAVLGLKKTVMIGAEYGFMPTTTIASMSVKMWSAAADLRYFPFQGAFFIGLRGGYQSLSGSTTLSAESLGSYTESVEVGTWFANPRVGFLWVWKPFALGIDAGVQIPLSTTVSRCSLLAALSPDADARITSTTNTLGRTVLPTLDLLRLGVVF